MKFKLLLLLLIVLLLFGCYTLRQIDKFQSIAILNFTKYAEKGFLLTTEPYNGKYESIGIINCKIRAGAKKEKVITDNSSIDIWFVEDLETEEILDLAYAKAIELGGNCIMNFRILPNDQTYIVSSSGETYTVPGIEIYGFIIKRID